MKRKLVTVVLIAMLAAGLLYAQTTLHSYHCCQNDGSNSGCCATLNCHNLYPPGTCGGIGQYVSIDLGTGTPYGTCVPNASTDCTEHTWLICCARKAFSQSKCMGTFLCYHVHTIANSCDDTIGGQRCLP